jgi:hypothetical protein
MQTRRNQYTVMDGVYWLRGEGSPCARWTEPTAPADGDDRTASRRSRAAWLRTVELFTGEPATVVRVVMLTGASVTVALSPLLLPR